MRQFLLVLKVVVANWKKTKGQLIFTILGIAIASTLWSSIDIVNDQTIKAQKRSIALLQSAFKPIIIDKQSDYVSQRDYVQLRLDGWIVNPVIRTTLDKSDITIVGIDFLADRKKVFSSQENFAYSNFLEMQANNNDLLFGTGKTLAKVKNRLSDFVIVRNDQLPANTLIGDISTVQNLLEMEGKFTYLEYVGRSLHAPDKLTLRGLMLIDDNSASEFEFISESFTFNLKAFGFLSFFVGMFIVYTSVGMAYEQRKQTVRILKTIGVERTLINVCLTSELFVIAICSGLLGSFGGFLLAQEFLPNINNTVSTIYNSPVDNKIELSISRFLISILIAGLGTLLACSRAILKLDKLKPVDETIEKKNYLRKRYPLFFSATLLFFTIACYHLSISSSLKIANFLFLGLIIAIGCAVLPIFINSVLSSAIKKLPAQFALSFWLLKDTQKFATLLFAGYLAFFLALSINVGVHGMVTSFKSTFVEWLEKRIFADYYINIASENNLNKILDLVKKHGGESFPIIKNEGKYNNETVEIYGFKPTIIYEKNWPLLENSENAWAKIRDGEIIFVSEQLSIREKIEVDDFLELEINNKRLIAQVGGIYADYGNPRNQLMMQLKLYKTFFSSQIPSTIAVKLDDSRLYNFLNDLSLGSEINSEAIIEPKQVRKISLEIFDNTFKISFQLALITLFVAAFTLYTNLTSINKLRGKDLLPVYLIGFSAKQILRLELLKVFILTNLVTILSIAMGVIISFTLSEVINPNFFGWKIPIKVFPEYWLQIWIVALVASIFATILSIRESNVRPSSSFDLKNYI